MTTISSGRRSTVVKERGTLNPLWKHIDVVLGLVTVGIACFGVLMVYSATRDGLLADGASPHLYLDKQALFVVIGVAAMAVAATVDYRRFQEMAGSLYLVALFILLVVYVPHIGHKSLGAQAWIALPGGFQLEPSEFAKILLIVSLGAFLSSRKGVIRLRTLVTVLVLAVIPMGLIYKQPDLGTALILGAVLLAMLLVAGVRGRHMAMLVLLIVVVIVAAVHFNVLKHYQTERLTSFLNPSSNTQSATYNLSQSKITISSGGVTGKGLFKGTQTDLEYVPEQRTDFIFTAVGEQLGLVGSAALLLGFGIMTWRIYRDALLAKDMMGTLICIGVLGMFVFQIFENVGMTMGIMPIAGIPLPFISYGGSSVLTAFIGIGLVINVRMRRFG